VVFNNKEVIVDVSPLEELMASVAISYKKSTM